MVFLYWHYLLAWTSRALKWKPQFTNTVWRWSDWMGRNRTGGFVLVIFHFCVLFKLCLRSVGTAGDPEGSAELWESSFYAHSCQGDGLCGRAGPDGWWEEHPGSHLAGDAQPRYLQGNKEEKGQMLSDSVVSIPDLAELNRCRVVLVSQGGWHMLVQWQCL